MIDPVAITWVVIAAIGTLVAGVAVREAQADVRSLGNLTNGRRTLATANRRSQFYLLVIEAVWLCVGFPRMFDNEVIPLTDAVAALLFTSALLALKSYQNLRDRRRVARGDA